MPRLHKTFARNVSRISLIYYPHRDLLTIGSSRMPSSGNAQTTQAVCFPTTRPCSSSLPAVAESLVMKDIIDKGGDADFHKAIIADRPIDHLEELEQAGLKVNQPNSAGRLPLHLLCSFGTYDEELSEHLISQTDWLVRRTANIDARDNDGITALHLASMMSEYHVKVLLATGADPWSITSEGLTCLHLAARARQGNIVSMLIAGLAKATDTTKKQQHINKRDQVFRSPLHYACRSGRPETVLLLLDAGADSLLRDENGMTPLDACVEFEDEQVLWSDYRKPDPVTMQLLSRTLIPDDWAAEAVGGVRIDDSLRPWVIPGRILQKYMQETYGDPFPMEENSIQSPQHTARLEEILHLLVEDMMKRGESIHVIKNQVAACIQRCEVKNLKYTASCFRDLHNSFDPSTSPSSPSDADVLECLQNCREKLSEASLLISSPQHDSINLLMVDYLLRQRQYRILHRIFRQDGPFPPLKDKDIIPIAHLLTKHGFTDLLKTLLASTYRPILLSSPTGPGTTFDPLLITASRRELPNMTIIRLLIETVGVDINARSRTGKEIFEQDMDGPGLVFEDDVTEQMGMNTALHEMAKGFHWWQVQEGIPYLLAKGANREVRNEDRLTALEMAEGMAKEVFTEEAVKALRAGRGS